MSIKSYDAANYICNQGDWKVSNLALQKLLYLAHMVHLGRTGEPLVNLNFEAWDYGPVCPKIYHRAKAFGNKPIPAIFNKGTILNGSSEEKALDDVCDAFLGLRPAQLVAITHAQDGAWAKHYQPGVRGITIPDEDIAEEYRKRISE